MKNHSFTRTLAVVVAFWSLVGIAYVNFGKTSVITRTFSLLSVAGSRTVKSIAKISSGLVANRLPIGGRTLGFGIFARVNRSHFLIQFSMSEYILGQ